MISRSDLPSRHPDPHPWLLDAACRGMDPALFYPTTGESPRQAIETCRRCPVREPCLACAVNNRERDGVWGGMTERQRRKVRRAAA